VRGTRAELEQIVRLLGKEIAGEMDDLSSGTPLGFMLMVFDFKPGGFCAYVSNAQRADMVKALREQADRMEAGTDATKGEA
jgi:hypothetical protein